jgi:sialic acid synthase SpsE
MKVGMMKIAEIGWNFMGDMDLAEKMIVAAGEAGASHVKFQYWQEKNLKEGPWDTDGRRDIYKAAQLDKGRIQHLNAVALRVGLVPFYSVFSLSELETLANISRKLIKIPSHEIYNLDLIKKAFDEFETVILSTGACSEQELLDVANLVDNVNTTIVVMHCVSSYPCEPSSLNLPRLQVLETLFPKATLGLSDHTSSTVTPAVAVGFKVSVVEKHFTIDNNLPGRDNKFALLPDQFKEMVQNFDEAAAACRFLGVGHQLSEKDIVKNYRGRWG